MPRHSWDYEKKPGRAICDNCGLDVKAWRVKEGGLPLCDPKNLFKQSKIDCPHHMIAAVAGSLNCWHCGRMYTPAELKAARKIREKNVEKALNPVKK
jgi:formylmethanofuran dehydrogenase subunit E